MELVRYIHLNPIRAKLVRDLKALDRSIVCGHSVIIGSVNREWQDVEWVLGLFDSRPGMARRKYRSFIQKGIHQGKRDDLIGGGLVRSGGGWSSVKAMRKAKVFEKSDERILGDGDFVQEVLSAAEEQMEKKYALHAKGYDLDKVASKVSELLELRPSEIWAPGKERHRVKARSLLCYWASRDLGISMAELARRLNLSLAGVSLSVKRWEEIAENNGYKLTEP